MAVLDFQSLYPSIICAFGLCFGTFIGMADEVKNTFKDNAQDSIKISEVLDFRVDQQTKVKIMESENRIIKTINGACFIEDKSKMFIDGCGAS